MERTFEVAASRAATVGSHEVRRALPKHDRRTVGAWCFADHMGPHFAEPDEMGIAPHPHIGIQTVTWLLSGELVHRDSLDSEQPIRPGELNLMTSGHGVAHSEEPTGSFRGLFNGIQLWVALPSASRDGANAFEHHAQLPKLAVDATDVTVLVGTFAEVVSPARRDSDHFGVDLDIHPGGTTLPLRPECEQALVVLDGQARVEGHHAVPGNLYYLGKERQELEISATERCRAVLIGGVPFDEEIVMWWNFVARTRQEIGDAYRQWQAEDTSRFGQVQSRLARIPAPDLPWNV